MRSLRRSHRVKTTSYKIGDAVEVMHGDGVFFKGKIIREAITSTPSNPLWIISLRDGRRRNKEVHERSLRKLGEEDSEITEKISTNASRAKKEKRMRSSTTKLSSITSSSDPDEKPESIEASTDTKAEKSVLSRKRAGKRRRGTDSGITVGTKSAKKQKAVSFEGQINSRQGTQRVSTRSSSRNNPGKNFAVLPSDFKKQRRGTSRKGGPRSGAKANSKNEEVVTVKMLTGTLYLYRGENRRAEFIRFF